MDLGLDNKVVVIAGASRGIGLAAARGFHEEGAKVVMVGRDPDALGAAATGLGGDGNDAIETIAADVTRPEHAREVVTRALERWGRIDILVSAVGQGVRSTLESATPEVWEENWRTNLLSAVAMTRAVHPAMQKEGSGRIVLLGAASGIQPTPGQIVSNVHKAGLIALGKSLALELAAEGIRVNVVCPGRILTDRRERRAHAEAEALGITVDEQLARVARTVPLGVWGRPEQVAAMIVFLCSEQADYVTGQVIAVDGGLVRAIHA